MLYQIFSRNNDSSGNPYRLLVVYNEKGTPVQAYEARSSSPNIEHVLYSAGYVQLITIHLEVKEYNRIKRGLNNWSSVIDGVVNTD